MSVQTIRGIKVVFKPNKPEQPCICNPDDGECVFYQATKGGAGRTPCPPEAMEPGTECCGIRSGVWVAAPQDEQAQDSTVPSMVAP